MADNFIRSDFCELKRKALTKYFSHLNDMQREAVFTVDGPVLILAGAGSGKTTVLVNRVANMIYFGNAYHDTYRYSGVTPDDEKFLQDFADGKTDDSERLRTITAVNCVNPWNILAITFTNKAAGELKERLHQMLGSVADGITAATFHSACVRILRREIDKLGYSSSFTIYDTDDSQRVIKGVLQDYNISDKRFPPKEIMREISSSKESQVDENEYAKLSVGDYRKQTIAKVYSEYQHRLRTANALDFDDIILLTVRLFEDFPDVLEHYQNLYKYILVDEYQDTNMVQYRLISMLSAKRKNLCVVGDDDQSIYKFRGATIENILSFEHQYENAKVIRLEQNYRSTQNILTCANEVIRHNRSRKGKKLWTSAGDGEKVTVYSASTESSESKYVAETVLGYIKDGGKYSDNAVLYRMNAQSNSIENTFMRSGIPYKVIGGLKFFDRKEVKDIVAYLSVLNNENDLFRLKRIINEPKRGIGAATVDALESISRDLGESPLQVMRMAKDYPILSRSAPKLMSLANMFDELREHADLIPLPDLLDELMSQSGYQAFLETQGDEGITRLENINELKSTMVNYIDEAEEPSLSGFLEDVALISDIDSMDSSDSVTLMTVHSAKGLEFNNVFVVGMEENIFPSSRSMDSEEDVEEERRLAYVAITRARKHLSLSHARQRLLFGSTNFNRPSRFLSELPDSAIEKQSERTPDDYRRRTVPQSRASTAPSYLQQATKKPQTPKPAGIDFSVGERVHHNVFGDGTVLKVTKMSNDSLLEVAFDTVGTKKIMAAFAKITKL